MDDLTGAFREVLSNLRLRYTEKGNRLEMLCFLCDLELCGIA